MNIHIYIPKCKLLNLYTINFTEFFQIICLQFLPNYLHWNHFYRIGDFLGRCSCFLCYFISALDLASGTSLQAEFSF